MIDTERTDEITCPHCGYEHRDSWEWHSDGGCYEATDDFECGSCEKTFLVSRHVPSCYYSSEKIKPTDPNNSTPDGGEG